MPKLVCPTCGREVYAVAPLKTLFAEERGCTRCGAELIVDRREPQPETPADATSGTTDGAARRGPPAGIPERRWSARR